MDINPIYIIAFAVCLVFIVATLILSMTKRKFLKYIPLIVAALAAFGLYIKAYFFSSSENFEALGYFVFMLISVAASVVSALTAIIMDVVRYAKTKKIL